MIRIHKKTNKRLLLKCSNSLVSTLYVLDENDNKILDKKPNGGEGIWFDVNYKPVYKIVICINSNLIG